jgi:signal transduction histidine kinase
VWLLAGVEALAVIAFLITLRLSAARLHALATDWLLASTMIVIVALTWIMGTGTNMHLFLVTHAVISFFLYPQARRVAMWGVALLGALGFAALPAFFPAAPSIDLRLSSTAYAAVAVLIQSSAAVFFLLCAYYARRVALDAERRVAEAHQLLVESENDAMVGRLVAGILHESNTPLGAITSAADTLGKLLNRCAEHLAAQAGADPGAAKLVKHVGNGQKLVALINDSSARLRGVVDNLKAFVRLDEAEIQRFDIRGSIESALGLLHEKLSDRIEVECSFPAEPTVVRANASRVNRMFLALLENAVQAIEERGRIIISIGVDAGLLAVEISDTGKGIPKEKLPGIFELGFTENRGRIKMRMGLSTSRRLVQELGGHLALESEDGSGTRVKLELPAC